MIVWYVVLLVRYGNVAVGTSRWKTTVVAIFFGPGGSRLEDALERGERLDPAAGSLMRL